MYIGYDEKQENLRQTLRDYYAELLTPEIQIELACDHGVGPTMRKVVRQMGKDGRLGIGWPKQSVARVDPRSSNSCSSMSRCARGHPFRC